MFWLQSNYHVRKSEEALHSAVSHCLSDTDNQAKTEATQQTQTQSASLGYYHPIIPKKTTAYVLPPLQGRSMSMDSNSVRLLDLG